MTAAVVTTRFTKTFLSGQRSEVLRFPALCIEAGGVVALCGPTGVGKSTLLNILAGLDFPDASESPKIQLGIDQKTYAVTEYSSALPRNRLGFIFQQGFLLPNVPVSINVALPSLAQGKSITNARVAGLLERLRLDPDMRTRRAWQVSGGQAQQIAFARAIVHDPTLVFADEPTSSLDRRRAAELMGELAHWAVEDPSRTVLWVTHDLKLASEIADRVIVLGGLRSGGLFSLIPVPNPREEGVLESWVYGETRFPGWGEESAREQPSADEAAAARSAWRPPAHVQKLGRHLALCEMFSRRKAILRGGGQSGLAHTLADVENIGHVRKVLAHPRAACKAFADMTTSVLIAIAFFLTTVGMSALIVNERLYRQRISDPDFCRVAVVGKAGAAAKPFDRGKLEALKERPWDKGFDRGTLIASDRSDLAHATCDSGPGAFARRDFNQWAFGVFDEGVCRSGEHWNRLLVTESNEPLLRSLDFRPPAEQNAPRRSIFDLYFGADARNPLDDAFVTESMIEALSEATGISAITDICVLHPEKELFFPLEVLGVLEALPSQGRRQFGALIFDDSYVRMTEQLDTPSGGYSEAMLYFDPPAIDSLERYLNEHERSSLEPDREALQKIRNALTVSFVVWAVILSFVALILAFTVAYVRSLITQYFEVNATPLAVLRSFGVDRPMIREVVMARMVINCIIAFSALLSVVALIFVFLLSASALPESLRELVYPQTIFWGLASSLFIVATATVLFVRWGVHSWFSNNSRLSILLSK